METNYEDARRVEEWYNEIIRRADSLQREDAELVIRECEDKLRDLAKNYRAQ